MKPQIPETLLVYAHVGIQYFYKFYKASTPQISNHIFTMQERNSEFDLLCKVMVEDSLWLDSYRSGLRASTCESPLCPQVIKGVMPDSIRIAEVSRTPLDFGGNYPRRTQRSERNSMELSANGVECRQKMSVANDSITLLKRASSIPALGKRELEHSSLDESNKKHHSQKTEGRIPIQSLLN